MNAGQYARPVIEALEPRILYSADLAPGLPADLNAELPPAESRLVSTTTPAGVSTLTEIAFVDASLADTDLLVEDLEAQRAGGRNIEVVLIGRHDDGILTISATLAGRSDIGAIHLFGHGSAGELRLGTGQLNAGALLHNANAIAGWAAAFTADADILLYGCNLAASPAGVAVVDGLASLTGADVAASDDVTGSPLQDADWELEYQQGGVEAFVAPGLRVQQMWTASLPITPVTATEDTYLSDDDQTFNYGASTSLLVDHSGGGIGSQVALVKFDLSAIPAGATITNVTLQMQATVNTGAFNMNVYEVTEAWQEGSGDGIPAVTGASWNQRQSLTPWTTPGGTFDPSIVATLNTAAIGTHSWDITALVQAWYAGTKVNNGLIIGSPDGGGDSVTYDSAEGTTPPRLVITYTVANSAPVITSDGGGPTAVLNVAENTTAVTTVTATDADGTTPTYSLGGADAALFTLDAVSGALSFTSAPDFETRLDANGDNVYEVTVTASDGGLTDSQDLSITVTNVNDHTPVITSNGGGATAVLSVAENTTAVTTVTATDADGTTPTYGLGGADAALFTLDAVSGALSFTSAPDFETRLDANGDNVYEVTVTASDGSLTDSQDLSITVTNVNDHTPVITSNGGGATAVLSVAENTTAVTTVTATDADGTTPTYGLGGADAALFTLDAVSGALSFTSAPDFETRLDANGDNVYEVTVTASDGSLTDSQDLSITVTNVNDHTPVITSNGGGATAVLSVAENTTAVTTVTATDADGTTPTYGLGGADAALFTLDAVSGALSFTSAPDFETRLDANGDNVYEVTVTASDGSLTDSQDLSITVTNVNDSAPVITSNGGGATAALNVAENTTAVTTVTATDADGTTPTYGLGGADAALFTLDAVSGALSFTSAPDFETRLDANGDNVYEVTVTASDGSLTDSQDLSITVTNVNDHTPVITSNGGGATAVLSVAENTTAVTTVTATDADGTTPTYGLGGADAALFTLDAVSGVLSFTSAPDFETRLDANGDNVYEVTVTASDGSSNDSQALSITVTNANTSAPILTIPPHQFTDAGIPLQIVGLAVADADSVNTHLLLTLSVGSGALTVSASTPGGVPSNAITGNGTSLITLTGTTEQINISLAGGGNGVGYLAGSGLTGTTLVTIVADDRGHPGGGPALSASGSLLITVSVTVLPTDLAPAAPAADVPPGEADPAATAPAPEPGTPAVAGPQPATLNDAVSEIESPEVFPRSEAIGPVIGPTNGPQGLSAALRAQGVATVPAAFGLPQIFGSTLLATGDLSAALERLDYLSQLDGLRNSADAPGAFEKQLAGFSAGGTIALSAGYVLWLLRGGALLASIVSSLPAWHFLDPLPVLRNYKRSDDEPDADDDEVENVFGGDRSGAATVRESSDAPGTKPREQPKSDL